MVPAKDDGWFSGCARGQSVKVIVEGDVHVTAGGVEKDRGGVAGIAAVGRDAELVC